MKCFRILRRWQQNIWKTSKNFLIKLSPRLARGLAFVSTNAVLVRKSRWTFGEHKPKAPSGRELPTKSGEGERVTIKLVQIQSYAGSFRHAIACHLPPGGRLCCRPIVHRKGVTHYTLQARRVKRSTNKTVRTPFLFRQVKPALWKATVRRSCSFGNEINFISIHRIFH